MDQVEIQSLRLMVLNYWYTLLYLDTRMKENNPSELLI